MIQSFKDVGDSDSTVCCTICTVPLRIIGMMSCIARKIVYEHASPITRVINAQLRNTHYDLRYHHSLIRLNVDTNKNSNYMRCNNYVRMHSSLAERDASDPG